VTLTDVEIEIFSVYLTRFGL